MSSNFKFYIAYALVYGLILLIGEGIYRFLRVKPELARNFSHLAVGLISLPFPWIFSSHWWVLLIAVQSSAVLFLTRHLNLLPSHHLSGSKSLGSYLFFVSIYLCFLASFHLHNPFFFVLPMLVLSISDVVAAVVGRNLGREVNGPLIRFFKDNKTLAGTLAFFLSSLCIVCSAYYFYLQAHFLHAFLVATVISVTTAITEAKSTRGYDNLLIPIISLLIMYLETFV